VVLGLVLTTSLASYFLISRNPAPALSLSESGPDHVVQVTLTPPWAMVKLDGREIGPADDAGRLKVTIPADPTATGWLEVSAKGYASVRRPLSVLGGVGDVAIDLVREPYELSLRTEPAECEVWIDGQYKGRSPLSITLLPDRKAGLVLKKAGYAELSREIAPPEAGGPLDLEFQLSPAAVAARVETEPPGAQVLLEGRVLGISPATIPLDPSFRGRTVTLTASLAGYEDARASLPVPSIPEATPEPLRLVLRPVQAIVEVTTQPPGGRVVIDGVDHGPAPVRARFDARRAGQAAVVEAVLGASHYGRQEVVVPPCGQSASLAIAMEFAAQRVVLIVLPAAAPCAEHEIVLAEARNQVHRLGPEQHFTLLAACGEALLRWPEDGRPQRATSEQKVRAYDMIRSIRPLGAGGLGRALAAAESMGATSVWVFSAGRIDRDALEQHPRPAKDGPSSYHLVAASAGVHDAWLAKWAAEHRGTFNLLGRDRLPSIAMDGRGGD
jgi:hypothetical protein